MDAHIMNALLEEQHAGQFVPAEAGNDPDPVDDKGHDRRHGVERKPTNRFEDELLIRNEILDWRQTSRPSGKDVTDHGTEPER